MLQLTRADILPSDKLFAITSNSELCAPLTASML
jgi:hypothetical protein